CTAAEARALVVEFLAHCKREQLRCVRIIHGKGLRSPNREPVLKRKLAGWLMQRDEIVAFCQARRTEGGGGAAVVLLKV
ncbi:MAG TPA: Smr/MutS family protein, partial [Burkholderiales bacterium]